MKAFLLSFFVVCLNFCVHAQNNQLNALPPGKYETVSKTNQSKWERGDIILIDASKYRVSTSDEIGEYRFSVTAQRVFFTSGPLKSLYARTSASNGAPAIILPVPENAQLGMKLASEIWGYYRQ
jgi:hypothetical protein